MHCAPIPGGGIIIGAGPSIPALPALTGVCTPEPVPAAGLQGPAGPAAATAGGGGAAAAAGSARVAGGAGCCVTGGIAPPTLEPAAIPLENDAGLTAAASPGSV